MAPGRIFSSELVVFRLKGVASLPGSAPSRQLGHSMLAVTANGEPSESRQHSDERVSAV
jgi:hypothetical protein